MSKKASKSAIRNGNLVKGGYIEQKGGIKKIQKGGDDNFHIEWISDDKLIKYYINDLINIIRLGKLIDYKKKLKDYYKNELNKKVKFDSLFENLSNNLKLIQIKNEEEFNKKQYNELMKYIKIIEEKNSKEMNNNNFLSYITNIFDKIINALNSNFIICYIIFSNPSIKKIIDSFTSSHSFTSFKKKTDINSIKIIKNLEKTYQNKSLQKTNQNKSLQKTNRNKQLIFIFDNSFFINFLGTIYTLFKKNLTSDDSDDSDGTIDKSISLNKINKLVYNGKMNLNIFTSQFKIGGLKIKNNNSEKIIRLCNSNIQVQRGITTCADNTSVDSNILQDKKINFNFQNKYFTLNLDIKYKRQFFRHQIDNIQFTLNQQDISDPKFECNIEIYEFDIPNFRYSMGFIQKFKDGKFNRFYLKNIKAPKIKGSNNLSELNNNKDNENIVIEALKESLNNLYNEKIKKIVEKSINGNEQRNRSNALINTNNRIPNHKEIINIRLNEIYGDEIGNYISNKIKEKAKTNKNLFLNLVNNNITLLIETIDYYFYNDDTIKDIKNSKNNKIFLNKLKENLMLNIDSLEINNSYSNKIKMHIQKIFNYIPILNENNYLCTSSDVIYEQIGGDWKLQDFQDYYDKKEVYFRYIINNNNKDKILFPNFQKIEELLTLLKDNKIFHYFFFNINFYYDLEILEINDLFKKYIESKDTQTNNYQVLINKLKLVYEHFSKSNKDFADIKNNLVISLYVNYMNQNSHCNENRIINKISDEEMKNFDIRKKLKNLIKHRIINNISDEEMNNFVTIEEINIQDKIRKKLKNLIKNIKCEVKIDKIKKIYKSNNNSDIYNSLKDLKFYKYSDEYNFIYKWDLHQEYKVIIFGDIHGSYHTFFRNIKRLINISVLKSDGFTLNENYKLLFLGDVIDRGEHSLEVILYIMILLKKNNFGNQMNIIYIRGNHEEVQTFSQYGFNDELKKKTFDENQYEELYRNFSEFIKSCPTAVILNYLGKKRIFCCHGCIPYFKDLDSYPFNLDDKSFDNYNKIIINNKIANQIRWNDLNLNESHEVRISGRGIDNAYDITPNYLKKFLKAKNLDFLIRGHQDSFSNTVIFSKIPNIDEDSYINGTKLFSDENLIEDAFSNAGTNIQYEYYKSKNNKKENNLKNTSKINSNLKNLRITPIGKIIIDDEIKLKLDISTKLEDFRAITISTNTDIDRNLVRDSFVIVHGYKNRNILKNY